MLRGESPPWVGYAYVGSILLAVGSAVLGLWAMFASGAYGWILIFALCGGAWLGALVHFCGWGLLGMAMRALRDEKGRGMTRDEHRMRWSFFISLLAFGFGIVTLPTLLPVSLWGGSNLGVGLLEIGVFPYVPSVFAPVVIAHVALFRFAARTFRSPDAAGLMRTATWPLAAIAVAGLLLQGIFVALASEAALATVGLLMFAMAGATSVGYALVAVAWRREIRLVPHVTAERSAVPSGPA